MVDHTCTKPKQNTESDVSKSKVNFAILTKENNIQNEGLLEVNLANQ